MITLSPKKYRLSPLVLILAVLVTIAFFPYLFQGSTFFSADIFDTMMPPYKGHYGPPSGENNYIMDGIAQTIPYKTATKEGFARGKLAYWNPYILGGYPQYAETMGNNFDIFNISLLWLDPDDAIIFETLIELLIAGIGMLVLLRFLGVSPWGNILFSGAYMLNSLFISSAEHRWIVASFCWIPFIVVMILHFFAGQKKRYLFYSAVFLALAFLGGNLQTSFFSIFTIAIIIFFLPGTQKLRYRFLLLSFVGLCAFALSAIMWLPVIELFLQTFRGGSLNSSSIFTSYPIIQRLISVPFLSVFFLPELFGGPYMFNIKWLGGSYIADFNGAIGFLPALFGLWGSISLWKNTSVRPFIILIILGVALPIATPLFYVVYHRFFILTSFALCIVGAIAFELFFQRLHSENNFRKFFTWTIRCFAIIVVILLSIGLFIAIDYHSAISLVTSKVSSQFKNSTLGIGNEQWIYRKIQNTVDYFSFLSAPLWFAIVSTAFILLCIAQYSKKKITGKTFLMMITIITFLQLCSFVRLWLPHKLASDYPIYPRNSISTFLHSDTSFGRYFIYREEGKDLHMLPENSATVYHDHDVFGFESLTPRTFIYFYLKNLSYDSVDLRLLGLANVKYIVTGKKRFYSEGFRWRFSADSMTIYENLLCKPRAYFDYKTITEENDTEVIKRILREDFDGSEAVLLKENSIPGFSGPIVPNSIHFDTSENEKIVITAESAAPGIFILTDTYYSGWKCYVNGKETPIFRVNYCMRGVMLGAGKSTIVFTFEPQIFTIGAGISGASLFFLLASFVYLKRKQKTSTIDVSS